MQEIFNNLISKALSNGVVGSIKASFMSEKAMDFQNRLTIAIDEGKDFFIPTNVDIMGIKQPAVINLKKLLQSLEDGFDSCAITLIDGTGDIQIPDWVLPIESAQDLVAGEVEVARLQGEMLPLLCGVGPDTTVEGLYNQISRTLSTAVTTQGQALVRLIDKVGTTAGSTAEFATSMVQAMIGTDPSTPFSPTVIGEVTELSGLSLWAADVGADLESWLSSATVVLADVIATGVSRGVGGLFIGLANLGHKTSWAISNIFNDVWIKENDSFSDCSFSNGFQDLGIVPDDSVNGNGGRLKDLVSQYTTSNGPAIAIYTFGATWYLYLDSSDNLHIGAAKHKYSAGSASSILELVSYSGNDWQDLVECYPGGGFSTSADWSSVPAYNDVMSLDLRETEKLIPLGLAWLAGDSLRNQFYQTEYSLYIEMFRGTDYSQTPSRADFIKEACYFPDSVAIPNTRITPFILTSLYYYMSNIASSSTTRYAHQLVTETVMGRYQLCDDAITIRDIKVGTRTVFTAVALTAIAFVAIKGVLALKSTARLAQVSASRAVADVSVPAADAAKLVKKANFLSKIAGISTANTATVLSALPSSIGGGDDRGTATIIKLLRGYM